MTAFSTRVLVNCDVRAMDEADTRAEALAWRAGTLVAVGTRTEVERAAGPSAEIIDCAGCTVLPGFIDPHEHPCLAALYGGGVRLTPPEVTDLATLQRALANAAAKLPAGEWLVAVEWSELSLRERRPPTRQELDDAVPDHPLLALHYSCHRAVANSRALELAAIGRGARSPGGGVIALGRGGLPTGLLIERAIGPVEKLARESSIARDPDAFFARLREHHTALVAAGVTRVADAAVPADLLALYREAVQRGALSVPTVAMPVAASGYLEPPWDALAGPVTGEADGLLSIGPLKLIFDGAEACAMCLSLRQALGAAVAALTASLCTRSFDPVRVVLAGKPRFTPRFRTGVRLVARDEAQKLVAAAVERGFAVASHAMGNEAVASVLSAYEACGSRLHAHGRPRVEHAGFLSRDLVARLSAIGAAVVAQPSFLSLPALEAAPAIPGLPLIPLRWLLDAMVEVAGSSDFPVADFAPLAGMRAATSRRRPCGGVRAAEQAIGLVEALALYTRSAARVLGCLDSCGTLEVGKRADVVVVDRELTGLAALSDASVRATILGGEVVHGGATHP